jgi:hypothetical protein
MNKSTTSKPQLLKWLSIFNGIESYIQKTNENIIPEDKEVSLQQLVDTLSANVEGKSLSNFKYTRDTEETALDLVKTLHWDISSRYESKKREYNVWAYNTWDNGFTLSNETMPLLALEQYIKQYWVLLDSPHWSIVKIMPEDIEKVSIKVVDNYLWKKNVPILTVHYDKEQNFARDKIVCPILRIALPKDPLETFPQVYSTWKWEKVYENKEFRRSEGKQALHGDQILELLRSKWAYLDTRLIKNLNSDQRWEYQDLIIKDKLENKKISQIAKTLFTARVKEDHIGVIEGHLHSQIKQRIKYLTAIIAWLKISPFIEKIIQDNTAKEIEESICYRFSAANIAKSYVDPSREQKIKTLKTRYTTEIQNLKKVVKIIDEFTDQYRLIVTNSEWDPEEVAKQALKELFPDNN